MADIFPYELKRAIEGLDNEIRQNIVSYLAANGRASYSGLRNNLNLTKGNLNYHLNTLEETGLIQNVLRIDKNEKMRFYEISHFGSNVIKSLCESLGPEKEIVDVVPN